MGARSSPKLTCTIIGYHSALLESGLKRIMYRHEGYIQCFWAPKIRCWILLLLSISRSLSLSCAGKSSFVFTCGRPLCQQRPLANATKVITHRQSMTWIEWDAVASNFESNHTCRSSNGLIENLDLPSISREMEGPILFPTSKRYEHAIAHSAHGSKDIDIIHTVYYDNIESHKINCKHNGLFYW